MKIQAKIPFTYMYPEAEPVTKKTVYWWKSSFVIETPGGSGTSVENVAWTYNPKAPVTVIFDGIKYENVPAESLYIGEEIEGTPDFTNYPFFAGSDEGTVYLAAKDAGTHTLWLVCGEKTINKLTITCSSESVNGICPTWNLVDANDVVKEYYDEEGIDVGASKTENVVYCTSDPEFPAALAYAYDVEKTGGNALFDADGNITLPEGVTTGNIVLKYSQVR